MYRDSGAGIVAGYVGYALTNDDGVVRDDVWVAAENFVGTTVRLATYEDGIQRIGRM